MRPRLTEEPRPWGEDVYKRQRLLYANIGQPHCPKCGKPIVQQSVDQMVDSILGLGEGKRILVMGPVVRGRKGEHAKVFEEDVYKRQALRRWSYGGWS